MSRRRRFPSDRTTSSSRAHPTADSRRSSTPRTNRNLFTVNVPKGWPVNHDLIWTLTVNGKTQKAFAWLRPEWEIDPAGGAGGGGGSTSPERMANKPPSVAVDPVANVKLPGTATLTATITDDGLPKPRPPGARRGTVVGQETPPTLQGGVQAPVNVPALARSGRGDDAPAGATAGAAPQPVALRGDPAAAGAAAGGGRGGSGRRDRPSPGSSGADPPTSRSDAPTSRATSGSSPPRSPSLASTRFAPFRTIRSRQDRHSSIKVVVQ